jgi:hypothetical protein
MPLLKKFNYVSVREKSGVAICDQCGVKNVEWVPDPTLLLNVSSYRFLCTNEKKAHNKTYCLLYMLRSKHAISMKMIYNWADKKNLEVIYISGNSMYDKYRKIHVTIPEWLYLIDHAEYVITDSFHGCVFSILFHKQFMPILLTGKQAKMNTRITSLFEMLDIHIDLESNFDILNKKYDWESIDTRLINIINALKLAELLKTMTCDE